MVFLVSASLIAVEEPESQDAIDAIVDHRRVAEDGMPCSYFADLDSVDRPSTDTINPYTDLEYCVHLSIAKLILGKMARTITSVEYMGIARNPQQAANTQAIGELYKQKGHRRNGSSCIVVHDPRRH